jgi:hypothetical protein
MTPQGRLQNILEGAFVIARGCHQEMPMVLKLAGPSRKST